MMAFLNEIKKGVQSVSGLEVHLDWWPHADIHIISGRWSWYCKVWIRGAVSIWRNTAVQTQNTHQTKQQWPWIHIPPTYKVFALTINFCSYGHS